MYELGSLLCIDDAAKLPNHFVTDIEKIVQDCVLLCPDGVADALPGEVLHDAGQNPIVASSIGKSQHTQVSKASVEDFPLMKQQQSPRWCSKLDAFVDIVQVGKDKDAFFVCVRTRTPNSKPVLDFLVQLRLEYLRSFGRAVDFNCTCHPSVSGEYYLNLAPVARMQRIKVPHGQGCLGLDFDFLNPDLGEKVTNLGLPVAFVDSSHGKGNMLAASAKLWASCLEGKPLLTRLYDFNRKLGSLPVAKQMVEKLFE
ncbi:unnamed protein product [Cladocopium goreaui]|uniref:Uncharacterized protein n=1 Tax=Cladocopium goreaui TaxID=2562237 RepID=A0A9P1C361_9DINO|nr:unnamed protein product [Cladocopium goreaui]